MPNLPPDSRESGPQSRVSRRGFLAASAIAGPVAWAIGASGAARAASAPVGLAWHDITNATVTAAAFAEPVTQSRTWAVSWLAAARAIQGSGDPDYGTAAFGQALHDTLVAQVPAQQAQLDASLAATLASVPDGAAKRRGIAAGASEAATIIAERAGDGLDTASVDISFTPPPPAPGVFQPTPPLSRPPVRAGQGNARPFLLTANDQFDPGPPPKLNSAGYRLGLQEVKTLGSATSAIRTAAQTDVANFWYPSLNFAYVQITRAVLADTSFPLAWQARFVAALHVITTDAQIATYNAKYKYLFWRPYTAITTGAISPDPAWMSQSVAPQHPEYPSGHGGYAGSSQGVLTAFLGPSAPRPISLTSPNDPGVTRAYHNWLTISREVIDARVWEGVHFRSSDITGVAQGLEVARWEVGRLARLGI